MKPGNAGGGKAARPPERPVEPPAVHRDGDPVSERLGRIRRRARTARGERVDNLMSHLDAELLLWSYERVEEGKATGVDGISVEEYGRGLEGRLVSLLERLHRESYRPQPSRRRWIPKGDGRQRPLGIPTTEDKIVQGALAAVLSEVYEEEFHDFSYGFRPGRGCHDALRGLAKHISHNKVNWIVEADIKGSYDNVDHDWLVRMVSHRVSDPRVLRLIRRMCWRKADGARARRGLRRAE
jgi:group II intron reverse transcriptase/maturase